MGIYDSGIIFGIKIYNFNDDDFSNILFEKKYNQIMCDEEKKKVYFLYSEFSNKNDLRFKYYTVCSSTYGNDSFLSWYPMSLNLFLQNFAICI